MKQFKISMLAAMSAISLSAIAAPAPKTIGILVPIALPAMDQIVSGFESEIKATYKGPVTFIVKNAQGNTSIQQSILQEFQQNKVDIIAPIGTDATQMAAHMIKDQPIIAIAAEMPKGNNSNVTNVLDEISVPTQIKFIHNALPNLKNMTLIYSDDDRIFADAAAAMSAAQKNNIHMQKLMIEQLPDLYTVQQHIAPNTQAIFALKDEMVVSGISALVQQAERNHMAVIASDDGSVGNGAAFALGVGESDIGKYSAKAAVKMLNGTPANKIPSYTMTQYSVFINPAAAAKQGIDVNALKTAAKKAKYAVDLIN